ncbi:hypothetical protein ACWGI8_16600 [Streptomyces sp. NPDC054841]
MNPEREDPRPHTPELEALLEAARRGGTPDPAAQERALAAFRAARDEGVHAAPVRRRRARDDWRPARERRRASVLVKALLAGLVAGALGGVAVAAGTGVMPMPFGGDEGPDRARSSSVSPGPDLSETRRDERGAGGSAGPTGPSTGTAGPTRPDTSSADAALCRVYLAALERKGVPPRGKAVERLEANAGGRERVRAHCERVYAAEERRNDPDPARSQGPEDEPEGTPGAGQPTKESGRTSTKEPGKQATGAPTGQDGTSAQDQAPTAAR